MRIISGKYKSRILKTPNPKFTRPTTDRNKGSIFDYLYNKIDFTKIEVLDVYAGSGALGLEALSRGAGLIHFVEVNFSVSSVLKSNIKGLAAEKFCKVFQTSAVKFSSQTPQIKYDLIIADPPFFKDDVYEVFHNVINNDFLKQHGVFIIERSKQTRESDEENFGIEAFKKLGDSLLYEYVNS
ncbi:MAG: 16S rRNA (guanine(966)-N(2))-methyltransferase RsmD [Melioribacteraceae bacterium]|nr:16S rRNA (guanine(966)-N(2))-methyltransferase RsmD [Melioribacteraceae bacterium]MCF8263263.1 16S rRNA (guanine(966)-N(2))-methyltransferase RsmD [Melioribacteraceae bacterium]MCF8412866.1 16S rRNA (guanine(966)-N(2))-methyltransferase RsmD [Melioribacteraceae bacterium]MCF8430703.1 16S rRNA (guanine(966)-N(2))-methyltransferase RsmD [Melioribacteraceae bacterium]